jgi:hypothetical protein
MQGILGMSDRHGWQVEVQMIIYGDEHEIIAIETEIEQKQIENDHVLIDIISLVYTIG